MSLSAQWKHVHLALILNVTAENELELGSGHTQHMVQLQLDFGNWVTQLFLFSSEFSWFSSGAEFTHPSHRACRLIPPSLYISILFSWHSPLPRSSQSSLPLRILSPAWKIRLLWMYDSFYSLCYQNRPSPAPFQGALGSMDAASTGYHDWNCSLCTLYCTRILVNICKT